MPNLHCDSWKRIASFSLVLAITAGVGQAKAQDNSFSFGVSNDAAILAFADDPVMLQALIKRSMWRFDNAIEAAFSRPAFELGNDATSDELITSFAITIGDEDFNFANIVPTDELILAAFDTELPAGVVASVTDFDSSAAAAGDDSANVLTLDFSGTADGGLAPGESIFFNAQLGFDTPPIFGGEKPSFDQVLFGAIGPGDPTNNALVTVTFADGTVAQSTLEDQSFFDFNEALHDPGNDRFFGFVPTGGTTTVIPEPATATLALLMAMAVPARRRRVA